jgi:hypothetical protein
MNLEDARAAVKRILGSSSSDKTIWMALRSKHLNTKKLRTFQWRLTNYTLTPNNILAQNPTLADCATCPLCNSLEDQNHIFTTGRASGQADIWPLVKTILERRKIKWLQPRLVGKIIISCLSNTKEKNSPTEAEGKDQL